MKFTARKSSTKIPTAKQKIQRKMAWTLCRLSAITGHLGQMQYDNVLFTPKELQALAKIRQALQQITPSKEEYLARKDAHYAALENANISKDL